jgi:MFS family permease
VVLLAMIAASGSAFFYPAMGAYLPSLAADERQLGPANSAWASLGNVSFILGPAVGGILIAAGDITLAFILNALSFILIAVILWTLPPSIPGTAKVDGGVDEAADPASPPESRDVAAPDSGPAPVPATPNLPRRPFSGILLVQVIGGFLGGGIQSATIVLAVTILNAGEEANGFLNAAIGIGGLIGAVLSGVLVLRRQLSGPLVAGAALTAAGAVLLGGIPVLAVALLAIGVWSAGSIVIDVITETTFQRVIPDQLRGRAFGLMMTIGTVAGAAGAFLLPVLLVTAGPLATFGLSGLAILAGTIASLGLLGSALSREPSPFEATIARVARLPLFAGVPPSRLEAALGHVRPIEVLPGEVIVREGDRADRFYIIESGSFTVSQADQSGEPSVLRHLGADEVFGEIGLLNRAPRSATVTADAAGTLLEMDGDDFLRLVGASPDVRARLLGLYGGAASARSS